MQHAFLPVNGETWLCGVNQETVQPLAVAPGAPDSIRRFSGNRREFGVLDSNFKRLAHYRILDAAPWFEVVQSPANLPKTCLAHALLVHNGMLLAGGQSGSSEALWIRQNGTGWASLVLPEGVGRRGKAVDALFIHQGELVAIDNILRPKWILVYPMDPLPVPKAARQYRLATHTTYETVLRATDAGDAYFLLSRGINHGTVSYHLFAIDKSDFKELRCLSGSLMPTTQQLINEAELELISETDLNDVLDLTWEVDKLKLINASLGAWSKRRRMSQPSIGALLADIQDMACCSQRLFVALGVKGLAFAELTCATRGTTKPTQLEISNFYAFDLQHLTTATRLEGVPGDDGFFVIGSNGDGTPAYEWISIHTLQTKHCRPYRMD